jgi:hypothetical protein
MIQMRMLAICAVAVASSCGSDSTSPATKGLGGFVLQAVRGLPVPAQISADKCATIYETGIADFEDDGAFLMRFQVRPSCTSNPDPDLIYHGQWQRTGDSLTIALADYPGQPLPGALKSGEATVELMVSTLGPAPVYTSFVFSRASQIPSR